MAEPACLMFFREISMFVISRGVESIRFLLDIKAPLPIVLGLALPAQGSIPASRQLWTDAFTVQAGFVSIAHTADDIDKTIASNKEATASGVCRAPLPAELQVAEFQRLE